MIAERWLAPIDVRLLGALEREPNLVRAARTLAIGRDRAVYRLRRLARLFGGPVAVGRRGGATPGVTRLTPLGLRLLRRARGGRLGSNRWTGTYSKLPSPRVTVEGGGILEVAFPGREGRRVEVEVDPEAFVVARARVALSARNALSVVIAGLQCRPGGTAVVRARWHNRSVRVALTTGSVARLGLRPGARVFLYAKAVAVRRVASRGPLRS